MQQKFENAALFPLVGLPAIGKKLKTLAFPFFSLTENILKMELFKKDGLAIIM